MMCSHAKELMAAYWQRELTVEDTALLRSHLETCPECSAEMSALGGLWERLADLPAPEPSHALDTRWHETINTLISSQPALRPSPRWSLGNFWPGNPVWSPAWSVALAATCLVIGVIAGMNVPHRNPEIAKLREEVSSTREMVALSLLRTAVRYRASARRQLLRPPRDHGARCRLRAHQRRSARFERQRAAGRHRRVEQSLRTPRSAAVAYAVAARAGFSHGAGRRHRLSRGRARPPGR